MGLQLSPDSSCFVLQENHYQCLLTLKDGSVLETVLSNLAIYRQGEEASGMEGAQQPMAGCLLLLGHGCFVVSCSSGQFPQTLGSELHSPCCPGGRVGLLSLSELGSCHLSLPSRIICLIQCYFILCRCLLTP